MLQCSVWNTKCRFSDLMFVWRMHTVCTLALADALLKGLFWTLGQCWSFVVCLSIAHALYTPSHSPSIHPSPSSFSPILQPQLQALSSTLCWMRDGVCVCLCSPQQPRDKLLTFDLVCCCHSLVSLVHIRGLNMWNDCCFCCLWMWDVYIYMNSSLLWHVYKE